MSNHTPGPWFLSGTGIAGGHRVMSKDSEYPLAHAAGHDLCSEANARLIAAAPDMLAALVDLFAIHLEAVGRNDEAESLVGTRIADICRNYDRVEAATRAAIAKATAPTTGESPK